MIGWFCVWACFCILSQGITCNGWGFSATCSKRGCWCGKINVSFDETNQSSWLEKGWVEIADKGTLDGGDWAEVLFEALFDEDLVGYFDFDWFGFFDATASEFKVVWRGISVSTVGGWNLSKNLSIKKKKASLMEQQKMKFDFVNIKV